MNTGMISDTFTHFTNQFTTHFAYGSLNIIVESGTSKSLEWFQRNLFTHNKLQFDVVFGDIFVFENEEEECAALPYDAYKPFVTIIG